MMEQMKEQLIQLKKETCSLLEMNDAISSRLWKIESILTESKSEDHSSMIIDLKNEKSQLVKKLSKMNFEEEIFKKYQEIAELEKKVNNRVIDIHSPSMRTILYDWKETKNDISHVRP